MPDNFLSSFGINVSYPSRTTGHRLVAVIRLEIRAVREDVVDISGSVERPLLCVKDPDLRLRRRQLVGREVRVDE